MNLTVYDVEDIFAGGSEDKFRLAGDGVIVYGTDGKAIASTVSVISEVVM